MEALIVRLCEIRAAWRKGDIDADAFKGSVLQELQAYLGDSKRKEWLSTWMFVLVLERGLSTFSGSRELLNKLDTVLSRLEDNPAAGE